MRKIFFPPLFLLLFVATMAQGQTLADYQYSTGHDASRWYSLDSTRNLLVMTGSRYYRRSALEQIGFSFPFADTSYTQFSVTHDGNLRLGSVLAISSSGNQGSPFVASRAGTNNPKINFMGCSGYSSDSVFVHKQLFGSAPERVLVVEFALQTYVTASRPSLLRWQVQMHENGDIQIAYPSQAPPILPFCNHQQGMCVDETDIWIVDMDHVATHYTAGYPTHIPAGFWPDTNRFYRFNYPVDVCPSPSNFLVASLDTLSATLAWDGDAPSYIVEYSTSPIVPGSGNASQLVVTDTTAYIFGLQAGTQYYFAVRAICGEDDTSNAALTSARTLTVEPFSANSYYCDFESADERESWVVPIHQINASTANWYVGTAVNNTQNGQYALYISADSGASNSCGDNWVGAYAFRSLNMEAGDWVVSFDWRAYGDWASNSAGTTTYYQFLRAFLVPSTVTVISSTPPSFPAPNATPHGTYVPQGWIELNPSTHSFVNQGTWSTFTSLVTVDRPGCYNLLFYWETDGYDPPQDLPAAIDNISVEHYSCAQPQAMTASSTDHDITLSWHRGAVENKWRVVGSNFDMVVFDTFCLVSGLEFNTLYTFEVFSICGEGDTSAPVTFSYRTSAGEPVSTYPYLCDFEDSLMARQWVTLGENQVNQWYVGTAANNTPQGEKSLYVSQDNGATNTYSGGQRALSYAYRMLMLDTADYIFSFDWRCLGDESFHFFRAFLVPANSIPAAGTFPLTSNLHVALPSGWIDLNPQNHYFSGSSDWTTHTQPISISSIGEYALLFMWENDEYAANNPPAAIDNISVATFTCPIPTAFSAEASQTYIDLTWDASDDATVWLLQYDDTAVVTFVPSYNAENLMPNTEYTFSVSSLCTNGDTSLPAVLTIRTACTPVETLPFFCDFSEYPVDMGSGDEFIPCWNRVRNHSGNSPRISTYGNNNCLFFNLTSGLLDDAIIVLPALADSIEVTYTELRFKAVKYDLMGIYEDPVLVVGVMSHPESASSFSAVDTIVVSNTDSYIEYSVPMLSYPGSDQYVAIRCLAVGDTYTSTAGYIDDVGLYELYICRKPSDFVAEVGSDTAFISWTPGFDEGQWQLQFADTAIATLQPSYIVRGLDSDRDYYFSLRSICDNGDTSEALSGHFRTLPPQDTVVVCLPVHNVVVSFNNPDDPYQATVCWNGSADAYEVAVTNNDDASSYSATVNGASCHTFNLDNIGATWSAIVRAICNDTLYSEWSDPVLFDTPPFVNPIGIDNSQLTTASTRFVVHPNPSNGTATVTLSAIEGPVAITVVDLMGRTVTSLSRFSTQETPLATTITDLPAGTYFIRVSTDDCNIVKRLIVK